MDSDGGCKFVAADFWYILNVVLASTGGAAEYQGGSLGEFGTIPCGQCDPWTDLPFNGQIFFQQNHNQFNRTRLNHDLPLFLYYEENSWWVSESLGGHRDGGHFQPRLRKRYKHTDNETDETDGLFDLDTPWEYYVAEYCEGALCGGEWRGDTTLLAQWYGPNGNRDLGLPPTCELLRVEGDAEVEKAQGNRLGVYSINYKGRRGRPSYELTNSQVKSYLLVKEPFSSWVISNTTEDFTGGAFIQSGRGTHTPTEAEAAGSVRDGVTKWRYLDDNKTWKEGNITISCLDEIW